MGTFASSADRCGRRDWPAMGNAAANAANAETNSDVEPKPTPKPKPTRRTRGTKKRSSTWNSMSCMPDCCARSEGPNRHLPGSRVSEAGLSGCAVPCIEREEIKLQRKLDENLLW